MFLVRLAIVITLLGHHKYYLRGYTASVVCQSFFISMWRKRVLKSRIIVVGVMIMAVGWNIRVSIAVSEGGFPSQRVPGSKATGA